MDQDEHKPNWVFHEDKNKPKPDPEPTQPLIRPYLKYLLIVIPLVVIAKHCDEITTWMKSDSQKANPDINKYRVPAQPTHRTTPRMPIVDRPPDPETLKALEDARVKVLMEEEGLTEEEARERIRIETERLLKDPEGRKTLESIIERFRKLDPAKQDDEVDPDQGGPDEVPKER